MTISTRSAPEPAVKLYGEEGIKEMPRVMGSEDFAYFMDVVPGIFGFLGSRMPSTRPATTMTAMMFPKMFSSVVQPCTHSLRADYLSAKAPK